MNILHIASFRGNLGDILNHEGFYRQLREHLGRPFAVEKIEIREFYRNAGKRFFDADFLRYLNSFDLCVLGGGGFFDVCWEYSRTGTTIDMADDFIDGIRIPVLVNAMGFHVYSEDDRLYARFGRFLSRILEDDRWLLTLRNDGSLGRLRARYGTDYGIMGVPDNGFAWRPAFVAGGGDKTRNYGGAAPHK